MSLLRSQSTVMLLLLVSVLLTSCLRASPPPASGTTEAATHFARIWMAKEVDVQGAPVSPGTTFSISDPRIYVVAEVVQLGAGSELFARWEKEGSVYEDSEVVQAERDLSEGYVYFFLEPEEGQRFEPGSYRVILYVAGQPAGESAFTIAP